MEYYTVTVKLYQCNTHKDCETLHYIPSGMTLQDEKHTNVLEANIWP
jgi:hypothetical protein